MKRFLLLGLLALFVMGCGTGEGDTQVETGESNISGCVSAAVRDTVDGDLERTDEFTYPASTLDEAYVVRSTDHYKGAPNPEFVLIEYGDFQCPACGAFSPVGSAVVQEFNKEFGIIYRHFPLTHIHPHAHKAAQAAESAGAQGKFWAFHDAVFGCQQQLSQLGERDAEKLFVDIATDLGIDADQVKQDLDDGTYEAYVDQSIAEAIALGVSATPSGLVKPFGAQEPLMLKGLPVQETWWYNTITTELSNRGIDR